MSATIFCDRDIIDIQSHEFSPKMCSSAILYGVGYISSFGPLQDVRVETYPENKGIEINVSHIEGEEYQVTSLDSEDIIYPHLAEEDAINWAKLIVLLDTISNKSVIIACIKYLSSLPLEVEPRSVYIDILAMCGETSMNIDAHCSQAIGDITLSVKTYSQAYREFLEKVIEKQHVFSITSDDLL